MTVDWSDERVEALRAAWKEGRTTNQIAAALNVTKNAVVGKAHRLGLSRPSPIRRSQTASASAKSALLRSPGLKATPPPDSIALADQRALKAPIAAPARLRQPSATLSITLSLPAPIIRGGCVFPIGNPGEPGFRFCDEPRKTIDRPYCELHNAICYQRYEARNG